jgi:hypothetical protein
MSFSRLLRAPPPSKVLCLLTLAGILHSYPQLRLNLDVIHLLHSRIEISPPIYNMP